MENQEQKDKPQEEIIEEREDKKEEVEEEEEEVQGEIEEEKQTQVEEVEPMEEKAQVEAKEEQRGGGRGLVYLALIFAIVALVLSFWNVGVQRVVRVLEKQEKVLEQKTKALEKTLSDVQAQALLSQIQMGAHRIYALTMGEKNYEAAARVLSAMEDQVNSLKAYYSAQDLGELEALLGALRKEVAKGPSPIPGLVAQLQFVTDRMKGAPKLALPAPGAVSGPKAKPAKVEAGKKETVTKKAPKEEVSTQPQKKVVKPQAGLVQKEKGALHSLLKSWSKLGEKLVGKKR